MVVELSAAAQSDFTSEAELPCSKVQLPAPATFQATVDVCIDGPGYDTMTASGDTNGPHEGRAGVAVAAPGIHIQLHAQCDTLIARYRMLRAAAGKAPGASRATTVAARGIVITPDSHEEQCKLSQKRTGQVAASEQLHVIAEMQRAEHEAKEAEADGRPCEVWGSSSLAGFRVGDCVHVYNRRHKRWYRDGVVQHIVSNGPNPHIAVLYNVGAGFARTGQIALDWPDRSWVLTSER